MYKLKVGDKVVANKLGTGKVEAILSRTPFGAYGPVLILLDKDNTVRFRNEHGRSGTGDDLDFTKVAEKKKIKVFLNIYNSFSFLPCAYGYATESEAAKAARDDSVGVAVPFEYEYEVKDN